MADHLEIVGQIVGDYRLRLWLGGGGFGNVYLAEHVHDGQQVAVKILQTRLLQPDDLRAFINEARTIRLQHPHIMPLLDFGISRENMPFLIMEYASKGTLRDRYPRGTRVTLPNVVKYTTQMAGTLQYAHDHHLVHRDVKPENMLVRSDEMILLSDFGIAITAQSTSSFSTQPEMAGTASYMAPEQLAGKPRAATDQYALAVVAYEWLAGHTPFQGSAVEVMMQHTTQPPPSLVAQVPGITQELEAVLFKALAKDYRERFSSIQEFATALQQASFPPVVRRPPFNRLTRPRLVAIPPLSPDLPPSPPSPVEAHFRDIPDATPPQAQLPTMQPTLLARTVAATGMQTTVLARTVAATGRISDSATLPVLSHATPVPRSPLLKGKLILSIVLALVIIAGSCGLFLAIQSYQATVRASAIAYVTASLATATAQAHAKATVSAIAANPYPSYLPGHGTLAFYDSLHNASNDNAWDKDDGCTFTGNAYHATNPLPKYEHTCLSETSNFRNFAYEAKVKIMKGDVGGFLFRENYLFVVALDGQYGLLLCDGIGKACPPLVTGSSVAINRGLNQTNLIAVIANGNHIMVYENQRQIINITNNKYSSGRIGVAAYALNGQNPTDVAYNDVKVWTF